MKSFALTLAALAACLLVFAPAFAQERTAGQASDAQVNWAALRNQIDAVSTQNKALAATMTALMKCNAKNRIYNPKPAKGSGYVPDADGCTVPTITSKDIVTQTASAGITKGKGKYASYAVATCPAGTLRIACAGSRNPSFTDTCDESSCGLVGAGPYGANGCITTVDDDGGTRATAWATCIKQN